MNKIVSFIIMISMLAALLTGCGADPVKSEKTSIVATIFPEYDWVLNILGDKAGDFDVTLLSDSGTDMHSFQPAASDMITISSCDMFIYVGGVSDEWAEDALAEAVNKNMITVNLLSVLGSAALEEEEKEGMEAEEHDHEEEGEYDEHVWLSLKNAAVFTDAIADAIAALDPENAEIYAANASAYIEKLNVLDESYQKAVDTAGVKTLLFGDRFPFLYMTKDYGLDYYAAFSGCSAESDASFETIAFLAGKLDELCLSAVLTLEGSDQKIAETVISASKGGSARILTMDSMQSVTSRDIENGATYLSIMENDLSILKDALQ